MSTDNEAALIGGLISTYFFLPGVRIFEGRPQPRLEHLHVNAPLLL